MWRCWRALPAANEPVVQVGGWVLEVVTLQQSAAHHGTIASRAIRGPTVPCRAMSQHNESCTTECLPTVCYCTPRMAPHSMPYHHTIPAPTHTAQTPHQPRFRPRLESSFRIVPYHRKYHLKRRSATHPRAAAAAVRPQRFPAQHSGGRSWRLPGPVNCQGRLLPGLATGLRPTHASRWRDCVCGATAELSGPVI